MRLSLFPVLVLFAFSASCDRPPAAPEAKVEAAWVSLPAVPGRPGAAYFTLSANHHPTRLVQVPSPRIERIELHESGMHAGMMKMVPLRDVTLPERGSLEFAPGSAHAMLFGLDSALRPGDTVPLTFAFEPAPSVTVEAKVLGPGETPAGD